MQMTFDTCRITSWRRNSPIPCSAFSQSDALLSGTYARSEQIQVNVTLEGNSDLVHAAFEGPGAELDANMARANASIDLVLDESLGSSTSLMPGGASGPGGPGGPGGDPPGGRG